jgi:hypothetical protein
LGAAVTQREAFPLYLIGRLLRSLTELLVTLADRQKARSVSIHDRCQARYERSYWW